MEPGKQRGGKRRDVPRRSRAAQRTIRRQQIIDATIHSVATLGFADTTLATVAKNTDISQAALVFHFKTKDALLTAALEYLVNQHRAAWRSAIEGLADDPLARICAMIRVDFSPEICTRKRVAVWHAFYGEAKTRPTYLRLCDEQDKEHTAFLESACREMTSAGRSSVDDPAIMAAMIDGLYIRQALRADPLSAEAAIDVMMHYLDTFLEEGPTTK